MICLYRHKTSVLTLTVWVSPRVHVLWLRAVWPRQWDRTVGHPGTVLHWVCMYGSQGGSVPASLDWPWHERPLQCLGYHSPTPLSHPPSKENGNIKTLEKSLGQTIGYYYIFWRNWRRKIFSIDSLLFCWTTFFPNCCPETNIVTRDIFIISVLYYILLRILKV